MSESLPIAERDAGRGDPWERVNADPEVVAARAAIDAHEAEEDRLTLKLGRALRRARAREGESGATCASRLPLRWGSAACDNPDPGHSQHSQEASGHTWTDADAERAANGQGDL